MKNLVKETANEAQLQAIANAFMGCTVNCGGDASHGGKTRQIGDAKWMNKTEANNAYPLATKEEPSYYDSTYMQPRLGERNALVLVLIDTQGRCITWIDYWKALTLYNKLQSQDSSNDLVLRLY